MIINGFVRFLHFKKKNDAWTIVFLSFVLLQSHWDWDVDAGERRREKSSCPLFRRLAALHPLLSGPFFLPSPRSDWKMCSNCVDPRDQYVSALAVSNNCVLRGRAERIRAHMGCPSVHEDRAPARQPCFPSTIGTYVNVRGAPTWRYIWSDAVCFYPSV